jgi:hypothetical protein
VAAILAAIRHELVAAQEEYQFCRNITKYSDAVLILRTGTPAEIGVFSGRLKATLPNYTEALRVNDSPDQWRQHISKQVTYLAEYVRLLTQASDLKEAK